MVKQVHAEEGRRPVWGAGRWFPAQASVLRGQVEGYLAAARVAPSPGRLLGGIAPHAGLEFSGAVAAHTFRAIRERLPLDGPPELVVVLGFVHRGGFSGCALMDGTALVTPLGESPLDAEANAILARTAGEAVRIDAAPHAGEHSAENLIPFVQQVLPGTPLVVGLFGGHAEAMEAEVGHALHVLAAQRRLLVLASTDLLHDPDYDRVTASDRETLRQLAALELEGLQRRWRPDRQVCCGISAVSALLHYLRRQGPVLGSILAYRNCGDDHPETRGRWVVGYGAVVYGAMTAPEGALRQQKVLPNHI